MTLACAHPGCETTPAYVDRTGATWCAAHADRPRCQQPSREALAGLVALRRAQQPAGGRASRDDLRALGAWARPSRGDLVRAWADRVRELLAESPLRDLASAALEARMDVEAR